MLVHPSMARSGTENKGTESMGVRYGEECLPPHCGRCLRRVPDREAAADHAPPQKFFLIFESQNTYFCAFSGLSGEHTIDDKF